MSDLALSRVVCFTTDIEWAPDWAVRETFSITDRFGVPLTPFVTHESAFLRERLVTPEERFDVGVHPNFLQPSTHGSTMDEIIDHMMTLWPEARSYRAHCFYDHTRMSRAFEKRGYTYESNLCLFLQPFLTPFRSGTSLIRFPVFWEDDFHTAHRLAWSIDAIRDALEMPGLKIINVHPLLVALNIPSDEIYEQSRAMYDWQGDGWQRYRRDGRGVATFLEELLTYVREQGLRVVRLRELFAEAEAQDLTPFDQTVFRVPRQATYGWQPGRGPSRRR
jgi:polysaccharide deactylase WbmS-like protein